MIGEGQYITQFDGIQYLSPRTLRNTWMLTLCTWDSFSKITYFNYDMLTPLMKLQVHTWLHMEFSYSRRDHSFHFYEHIIMRKWRAIQDNVGYKLTCLLYIYVRYRASRSILIEFPHIVQSPLNLFWYLQNYIK